MLNAGIKVLYLYIVSLKNKKQQEELLLFTDSVGVISSLKMFVISGQATRVQFHVTVMSLDSIDEGSMVSCWMLGAKVNFFFNTSDRTQLTLLH